MEFTNDIKFGRKPMNNKILKLTYSGTLFKNNSSEVYIVYGFGENWEKTSEQKMEKLSRGFRANIIMENYNTFNFCFRNSQNEWDNNNSFNYITPIATQTYNSTINTLSSKEAEAVCKDVVGDVINNIDLNLDNAKETKNITVNDNENILDALVQELFEEYNKTSNYNIQTSVYNKEESNQSNQISNEEISQQNVSDNIDSNPSTTNQNVETNTTSNSNDNIQNVEADASSDSNDNTQNVEADTSLDSNDNTQNTEADASSDSNDNTQNIEANKNSKENVQTIIKETNIELDSILNDIIEQYSKEYSESEANENSNQNKIENVNVEKEVAPTSPISNYEDVDIGKALNDLFEETFSGNPFSIPEIENSEDLIPQASQYDIFEESNTQNQNNEINNVETPISYNNTTESQQTSISNQDSIVENDMFNFENLDFDFAISSTPTPNFVNNFSDSFYDDEDVSIHNSVFNIQEIVNETVKNLDQEVSDATNINTAEDLSQREEFDKAVSEFAEYFDNLIEEIVSTPSTSLSNSVTNEQVFESEKTELAVNQAQGVAIAQATNNTDVNESTDGVPKEFALYDYKSHSFFYMLKRRCKLLFSALFTKLPKVFGREHDTNNN